jgi:hypothetical protein
LRMESSPAMPGWLRSVWLDAGSDNAPGHL